MLKTAFRANLIPAIFLWGFALALLLLFYLSPPAGAVLNQLAAFKTRLGLGFSMPAQAFAGGLLPFLFQKLQRGNHRKTALAHVPYLMAFWACQGALTDGFYRLQAHTFGDNNWPATVALKIVFDMLLYTPLLSVPLTVLAFEFKNNDFSLAPTLRPLGIAWYRSHVAPIYAASLLVWTPTVAVLYSLPLALQFPMQAIVQCFWGLIVVILTSRS